MIKPGQKVLRQAYKNSPLLLVMEDFIVSKISLALNELGGVTAKKIHHDII